MRILRILRAMHVRVDQGDGIQRQFQQLAGFEDEHVAKAVAQHVPVVAVLDEGIQRVNWIAPGVGRARR